MNPQRDSSDFRSIHLPEPAPKPKVAFSPNIVKIHITDPSLPELSFFDLPGAINIHEDASGQYLVTFVERLIKNYVREGKSLILLTVACDQDTENSTAFRLVNQSRATNRCMGVLTKPDLLTAARYPHIRRMLEGDIFKLGRGWYVAKSLSQVELEQNITHLEARQREETFFAKDEP